MSEMFKDREEELAVGLFDRGIIKFGEFTLKSGRIAPIYYNQRPLLSIDHNHKMNAKQQKEIAGLAIEGYAGQIENSAPHDHLYGIPQAATAIGACIAHAIGDSYLWGRVGKKDYGKHEGIEGNIASGETVLQLDDVVTNANSKIESAVDLQEAGLQTVGFVIMLDREEGAQALHQAGYTMQSVFKLSEAIHYLVENKRIGSQEVNALQEYHVGLRSEGVESTYSYAG